MGKRGPKPKPKQLLVSWRRNQRKNEPEPSKDRPVCPSWLPPMAKTCWKHITAQLESMGLLSATDTKALERYCVAWSAYRDCVKQIEKHGQMVALTDGNGNVVEMRKNPLLLERARLSGELLRLEQQFGLTPSARAGLGAAVTKPPASGQESGGDSPSHFQPRIVHGA